MGEVTGFWNTDAVRSATPRWTVTTWNVQGSKGTDIDRVVDVLSASAPDIVLLQEVRRPQANAIASRLDMVHEWTFKHHAFFPLIGGRAEGAAILTPHGLYGRGSQVISSTRWRRWWRRRVAQWGVVRRGDHSAYRVINAHLSPHDLRAERREEADEIVAIAERLGQAPPLIVGGDFNDHGDPEPIERLPGTEHVPSPPTNPAEAPVNVLDHVLLPADALDVELTVPDGGEQWEGVSDHLPVTVSFSMRWVTGDYAADTSN